MKEATIDMQVLCKASKVKRWQREESKATRSLNGNENYSMCLPRHSPNFLLINIIIKHLCDCSKIVAINFHKRSCHSLLLYSGPQTVPDYIAVHSSSWCGRYAKVSSRPHIRSLKGLCTWICIDNTVQSYRFFFVIASSKMVSQDTQFF